MRVAIVSEFREGFRPALEECYAVALEGMGHDVRRIATFRRLGFRGGLIGRLTRKYADDRVSREVTEEVAAIAPDLVLIVKGAFLAARGAQAWRDRGITVANVFPDNPFDVMGALGTGGRLLDQLRTCDRVFVHDRLLVGQLRQVGVRSAFLAFARDPDLHDRRYVEEPKGESVRIAFVGNPDPERIRFLRTIADLGLGLWGAWHWARLGPDDPLARCVQGGALLGRDMTRVLGASALSINILRTSQKTAHNMRTFESPACGVCTLSEASNGVLELMEDGREVVTFRSPEELRRMTLELLDDPERMAGIAEAGWRRVEGETYERRARQILAELR